MNTNQEIVNVGLYLSMEFGDDWLKPINKRLAKRYPKLLLTELEHYNKLCREVNTYANDFIRNNSIQVGEKPTFLPFEEFKKVILKKYIWINEENLKHLYSQSCYYAWK